MVNLRYRTMKPSPSKKEAGLKRLHLKGWIATISLILSSTAWAQTPERLECEELSTVLMAMESTHYDRVNIASKIEGRAINQYIEYLDGAKTLFLEKEVKQLKRDMSEFDVTFLRRTVNPWRMLWL